MRLRYPVVATSFTEYVCNVCPEFNTPQNAIHVITTCVENEWLLGGNDS